LFKAKRKIQIRTMEGIRGGFSLFPNKVSDQDNLAVLQPLFEQSFKDKIAAGMRKIWVEIPMFKLCLKICNFSFHNRTDVEGKSAQWMADQLATILAQTSHRSHIKLYSKSKPRISRNSPHANNGTVWFDIHDSQGGLNLQNLVGKSFIFRGRCLSFTVATKMLQLFHFILS